MRLDKIGEVDPIKRRIQAAFPDIRISILDNPRDYAASMLYIRNVPVEFREYFKKETDFVSIPIGSRAENDYLIIPISLSDLEAEERHAG